VIVIAVQPPATGLLEPAADPAEVSTVPLEVFLERELGLEVARFAPRWTL
jgi:hypothetical protein